MYKRITDFVQKKFKIDAHYFVSGGFWLSLGQLAAVVFGLTTTALLAYFLSENDYGVYRYLIAVTTIFSAFSLTGLGQAVMQTAANKFYGFYRETIRTGFCYSLFISLLALSGATYYWLNDNLTLSIGCVLIAFIQPLISTFQFIPPFLHGSKRFRDLSVLHIIKMLFISGTTVAALILTKNIIILFGIYLSTNLLANVISYLILKPEKLKVPDEVKARYLKYAQHTSVRGILSNLAQKLDMVVVFTHLGAAELALYSIASVIPEQIKGSFKNIATLLLPKYSTHPNLESIKQSLLKRSIQLFFLMTLLTIIYILIAPYLYQILFPKHLDAVFYSQLISLAFPSMIASIAASALASQMENRKLYKTQIFDSVILILLTIVFTIWLGLLGTVIGRIIHRYLIMIYNFYLIYKQ